MGREGKGKKAEAKAKGAKGKGKRAKAKAAVRRRPDLGSGAAGAPFLELTTAPTDVGGVSVVEYRYAVPADQNSGSSAEPPAHRPVSGRKLGRGPGLSLTDN